MECRDAPCVHLNAREIAAFSAQVRELGLNSLSDLSQDNLSAALRGAASTHWSGSLGEIAAYLEQEGIAYLDVDPSEMSGDPTDIAASGAFTAIALALNIISSPSKDTVNKTPFNAYTSSPRNEQLLRENGLFHYSQEVKLGFHNDGLLFSDGVLIPRILFLYNIYLDYETPGRFYYTRFREWDGYDHYAEKFGIDRVHNIDITPIVYEDKAVENGLVIKSAKRISAPIFLSKDRGLFINGRIRPAAPELEAIVPEMMDSIAAAPRFAVPQREGRVIFLRNDLGLHARDVMEVPRRQNKYTRSFLRTMDTTGVFIEGQSKC